MLEHCIWGGGGNGLSTEMVNLVTEVLQAIKAWNLCITVMALNLVFWCSYGGCSHCSNCLLGLYLKRNYLHLSAGTPAALFCSTSCKSGWA